jgi:DNA-binding winged helix-turn-helix (wHTH) protein
MKLKKRPMPSATNSWREVFEEDGATAMEFELPPFPDHQVGSDVDGITGVVFGDSQEPSSPVTLLDNTIASLGRGDIALQLTGAQRHVWDNYQVALVPLKNETDCAGRNSQAPLKHVLVLPLSWTELVGRLRAEFGSSGSGLESSIIWFGEVFVDFLGMEVRRSDEKVDLTTMEFKVLRFLVQNAGRVISRDEMLNDVWGYENYPCTRTVDNHILKLRQKLELDPAHPVHFQTVHGVGYKFVFGASRVTAEHRM